MVAHAPRPIRPRDRFHRPGPEDISRVLNGGYASYAGFVLSSAVFSVALLRTDPRRVLVGRPAPKVLGAN